MNVQTTLNNNGQVISQPDLIYQNDLKLNQNLPNTVPQQVLTQIIQPQLSQLEITGVSRSGQSIPSQKESNRFRIVKTDAEKKSESIDENNQAVQNEQIGFNPNQTIPNSIITTKAYLNDINSIQPYTANSYQRGRWIVSDYSTENVSANQKVTSTSLNQVLINNTNSAPVTISTQTIPIQQNQIKNDESNNYNNGYLASNQAPSVNNIDHNKIVQNISPNLIQNSVINPTNLVAQNQPLIQNQAQIAANATSYYIQNQQVYQQPQQTQSQAQSYQIINQNSSSIGTGNIVNQSTQIIQPQVNPTISNQSPSLATNNNFATGVSQIAPISQAQTQPSQINNIQPNLINQTNQNIVTNILPNTVSNQVHSDNTQSYKPQNQQNIPNNQSNSVNNTLPNQALKIPSQTIDPLTIGTNSQIINSQIPTQQTSPKDQNLVKAQTSSLVVTNIPENNQSNDSDGQGNEQATDSKKSDGGIHDRIAEAMDMVKSHLTQAVRDEIVTLKNQIKQLKEYCSRLEQENTSLKKNMPNDVLRQLENLGHISINNNNNNNNNNNGNSNNINGNSLVTISKNTTNNLNLNDTEHRNSHETMISSFTEHLVNKDEILNNIHSSNLIPKINGNILQEQINLVEQLSKNDN